MRDQISEDKERLRNQWLADVNALKDMISKMQNEIIAMQEAGAPAGHIRLRQEMIDQYEVTISKLNALITASN